MTHHVSRIVQILSTELSEPLIDPEIAITWIGGFFAAVIFWNVFERFLETLDPKSRNISVSGIAVVSGFLISIGYSPFGAFATEIARIFEVIPVYYPELIKSIGTIETGICLIYGVYEMWESGGILALSSFVLGFFGGMLLPYGEVGVFLVLISFVMMIFSPADRW